MEAKYTLISGFVERVVLQGPYNDALHARTALPALFNEAGIADVISNPNAALELKRVAHKYAPLIMDPMDLLSIATYENLLLNVCRYIIPQTSVEVPTEEQIDELGSLPDADNLIDEPILRPLGDKSRKGQKSRLSSGTRSKGRTARTGRSTAPLVDIIEPDYNEVFRDL